MQKNSFAVYFDLVSIITSSASQFGRAIVMPNVKPPITATAAAMAYQESILSALPLDSDFTPLMTLYLTDRTSPNEIKLVSKSKIHKAVFYVFFQNLHFQVGLAFGRCKSFLA